VPKPRRGPTRKDTRVQQLARSSVWTDGLVTCVRCPCVVTSVTPSMVTVSSLGSASVTSDTRAPAAGTVSSCPGVSTGTAPRASPATASRAGPGCSATTPSVTWTVRPTTGCAWPRGSARVSQDTRGTRVTRVLHLLGVSMAPAPSPWSVSVRRGGRGRCATRPSVQTRVVLTMARVIHLARVCVNWDIRETHVTSVSHIQAVSMGSVMNPTTATAYLAGLENSVIFPRFRYLECSLEKVDVSL